MSELYEDDESEALRREEWKKKLARMKQEQIRRQKMLRLYLVIGIIVIVLIIAGIVVGIKKFITYREQVKENKIAEEQMLEEQMLNEQLQNEILEEETKEQIISEPVKQYHYSEAENMVYLGGDNMTSNNAILVNLDTNEIVGQKDYKARIIPASMTKVLTVLVAAENITDFDAKIPVTIEATDYAYSNDCSSVGFLENEIVSIDDLFYGTILCSGGDAAAQLAIYTAGSMDVFVEMMNEKLTELGISDTAHFTNCVGLYNENHYCTPLDMAIIMNAAIDNEYCRKIMSAHTYTTSATTEHPEGITISNWFLRRIEDKDTNGEVVCAKTGYVVQSGNCGVCYAVSSSGVPYICVTATAHSSWRCIYDHVDILKNHT